MSNDALVLALDNSLDFLNIALARGRHLIEERRVKAERHSSEILPAKVSGLLDDCGYKPDDISGLVVTIGPGSFTGVRVGLAFCKGLAVGLGVPITGVPTPDAMAVPFKFMEGHYICPLIDAKKGEVFFALYRVAAGKINRVGDIRSCSPENLLPHLQLPCVCFGSGVAICRTALEEINGVTIVEEGFQQISGEALLFAGLEKPAGKCPAGVQPIYGRRSEAEIKFGVEVS